MTTDFPVSIFQGVAFGLGLSFLACLLAIQFARRLGLVDMPGIEPHKQHNSPTPIAGGLALVIALLGGWLLLRDRFNDLWPLLVSTVMVFGIGLLDDFWRVRIWVKLAFQVFAAFFLILFGIEVHLAARIFPSLPSTLSQGLDISITVLWLVGMTNAFNFVDSMDGLATGLAGIIAVFLSFASLFSAQISLAHFMAFLAGSSFVLYFFNSSPARLFLGDSGALSLGFLMASTSMLYNPAVFPQESSWFLPVMILGLPIFDILLVMISRVRRARPVYLADRGHTYHRLVALGFSPNRAVLLLHLISIILGCLAFIALNLPPLVATVIFCLTCLTALALIIYLDDPKRWP